MSAGVGLDWPGLIRLGLRELRLRPEEFWSLTPLELQILIGREESFLPMQRDDLNALRAAYPDETEG